MRMGSVHMAQPFIYTEAAADLILELMSEGSSLREIVKQPGMPSRATVTRWVSNNTEGFGDRYQVARQMQADALAEDIIAISDDASQDAINPQSVQRAKLMTENRKWLASKIFPRTYGDRVDGSLAVSVTMTSEQVSARLAELMSRQPSPQLTIEGEADEGEASD